ncbi:unnamed protein product [Didymodactylos carnosus]|uniref:Uncharacterized protein n=1 Tax=Didymodactylos carnosus TaxID=1234261 RepID=A0A8S2FU01_9BILA|nr:unnamed protein product [Didymodactylos carnosus]CAF4349564.1 unnamed protein product [Didymodactylos carnosus]
MPKIQNFLCTDVDPYLALFFTSQEADYDNGTFEYKLKHHYTQQPSSAISPFAGLSGLTDELFMQNYNSTSYDLAFNIDLSNRIVPFMDILNYNKTDLNSYAVDFYINGSEQQLLTQNRLQPGDVFVFLEDFLLILASIKTSLEVIVKHEKSQTPSTDLNFFQSLFIILDAIHNDYKLKFSKVYPARKYRM